MANYWPFCRSLGQLNILAEPPHHWAAARSPYSV